MAVYTTIDNPELYFQTVLYTSDNNGGSPSTKAITLDGDENMQPDFVWIKSRTEADGHSIYDSVRGVTKELSSVAGAAEATSATSLTAFGSDGFTVGTDDRVRRDHGGGTPDKYVAWCWKESADAGFDIVSYTGNGSARTISHSLSAKPHFIVVKNRSDDDNYWQVQHRSLGATKNLLLNDTNAVATVSTFWNDTEPTTSVFSVGTHDDTNENTDSIIAYLWSEKQGFSKVGSYTGNGNADGTFVYTGFRPAYLLIKNKTSSSTNWHIYDNKRLGYNIDNDMQRANIQNADATDDDLDILSNGFKLRRVTSALSTSGDTYIYMAFAEQPFVNSNGVPANAR